MTIHERQLLRYDSGSNDSNRILIFYSDLGLKVLARSNQIYGDGTFDTVARIFFQLYSIHADVFGYTFPCIYALCLRKTRTTHEHIYSHLIESSSGTILNFSPESIMVDFEVAAINVIKNKFPNSVIKGCLFHVNQSLWSKIQE